MSTKNYQMLKLNVPYANYAHIYQYADAKHSKIYIAHKLQFCIENTMFFKVFEIVSVAANGDIYDITQQYMDQALQLLNLHYNNSKTSSPII